MKVATKRMDDFTYVIIMAMLLMLLTSSCNVTKGGGQRYPYPGALTDPVTGERVESPR